MRLREATFFAAVIIASSPGCTVNQSDCAKNPALECFRAEGGAAGAAASGGSNGGGGMTGGGGSGGAACKVDECPAGNECEDAVCLASGCGLTPKKDGVKCGADELLTCKDGVCAGCSDVAQCLVKECNDVDCTGGACVYTVDSGAVECAGGAGTCYDGVCALCDDGRKNGDETGVDCGGPKCEKCAFGEGCQDGEQDCASGFCIDDVCCETECKEDCRACNNAASPGVCSPTPPQTVDDGCSGANNACGIDGVCHTPDDLSCSDHNKCASYFCKSGKCADCANDEECPDKVCINGSCFPPANDGASCQGGKGCKSGFCVDGVCCEAACGGKCMSCRTEYTGTSTGTCAPIEEGLDPHGECSGTGKAAACSGADESAGASTCGVN